MSSTSFAPDRPLGEGSRVSGIGIPLAVLDCCGIDIFGDRVAKQDGDDPLDRGEFTRRVIALAIALGLILSQDEQNAIADLDRALDADFANLAPAQRERVLQRAARVIARLPRGNRRELLREIGEAGIEIGQRAREAAVFANNLNAPLEQTEAQERAAARMIAPTVLFIEDEFERRGERFMSAATKLILAGIAAGLAAAVIRDQLRELARRTVQRPQYVAGVAASVLNRARTDSLLTTFSDSGVQRLEVREVMDERTCDKCRFMHGKQFGVGESRALLDRVRGVRDPAAVAATNPFLRQGRLANGTRVIYYLDGNGARKLVAQIDASGFGQVDATGAFSNGLTAEQLIARGIGPPPYHPFCRGVVVPA